MDEIKCYYCDSINLENLSQGWFFASWNCDYCDRHFDTIKIGSYLRYMIDECACCGKCSCPRCHHE